MIMFLKVNPMKAVGSENQTFFKQVAQITGTVE